MAQQQQQDEQHADLEHVDQQCGVEPNAGFDRSTRPTIS